ncbi:MAG: 3D-(3,5/4)-trihydroxycyclohexane-1,2-dione acylhydrolase (decyclizing), partial [Casimicrobiaceae bacterium]
MNERQPRVRLTTAQALVRYLAAQRTRDANGSDVGLFAGVFAIFGHGNVAALGEALYAERERLPTFRAHNEQAMAHTAIAYAKASMRRRMMACTTSIGPGATNLVSAAALAHVNRLPVLLLPGDIFVSRAPDPVLQQVESFSDGTLSANDCLRPVSRYFDRIVHPQQLLTALPRAIEVLTDAALCGPVTLALPQDVQASAFDYPQSFFATRQRAPRAASPSPEDVAHAASVLRTARKPLLIAGGGVLYSEGGSSALADFAKRHGIPVAETQAGKSALSCDDPLQAGAIGVTGATSANALARDADVIIAVGTRLSDFTTGSHALFASVPIVSINVQAFDALKSDATATIVGDAARSLASLAVAVKGWRAEVAWTSRAQALTARWRDDVDAIVAHNAVAPGTLPYEGDVIGAVQRSHSASPANDVVVCAAGTLPAELHKLWRTSTPGGYHVEYGYSCMGYEIAGGLGVKLALPEREVVVMLGDGSYLMMNSEIATAVAMQRKLLIVVLDNRGFACINRLQQACGNPPFNNLLDAGAPVIDFAAHARALGAQSVHVGSIDELEAAMQRARASPHTQVIVIDTDPAH